MRRQDVFDRVYCVMAKTPTQVWAWRQLPGSIATTVPRCSVFKGCNLEYTCVTGHVTSWLLWWDVLADVLGDAARAARWAGVLEEDMSRYLRDAGEVRFTGGMLAAWVVLMENGVEAMIGG